MPVNGIRVGRAQADLGQVFGPSVPMLINHGTEPLQDLEFISRQGFVERLDLFIQRIDLSFVDLLKVCVFVSCHFEVRQQELPDFILASCAGEFVGRTDADLFAALFVIDLADALATADD